MTRREHALVPRQLTPYHWFVFVVASAAWFFDCLDQRLFSLARVDALTELTRATPGGDVQAIGKDVTALLPDRLGRSAGSSSARWATGMAGRRCSRSRC